MQKHMICTECPRGCNLVVTFDGKKVVSVEGNACPKGKAYAIAEIERPLRILTATVRTRGLFLRLVPVRSSGPIPKDMLMAGMERIRSLTIDRPVSVGQCIDRNFLGLGVDLIATRSIGVVSGKEKIS